MSAAGHFTILPLRSFDFSLFVLIFTAHAADKATVVNLAGERSNQLTMRLVDSAMFSSRYARVLPMFYMFNLLSRFTLCCYPAAT